MADRPYRHLSLAQLQGIIDDPRIGAAAKQRAYDERQQKLTEASVAAPQTVAKPVAARGTRPEDRMNKTEARYAARLDADPLVRRWWYEHLKLRVGIERDWFTVDFMVQTRAGDVEMHEVKGPHVTEDAVEKFKAAALLYPMWPWVMVQQAKKGAEWEVVYEYAATEPKE